MRRSSGLISCTMLLIALALAGCANTTSGTGSAQTITNVAKVQLKSSAISAQTLPAAYTCDGKNINPPLEWSTIPADTGELVLVAVGLTKAPSTSSYTATIE